MYKRILIFFLFIGITQCLVAQELNFSVTVNTPKLQTVDPKVFESLETAIENLINNTQWTNDYFELEERIRGSIQLNITEESSATRFEAELLIQSSRPIYKSGQETVMFTNLDKNIWFDYEQFQPLEYTQNAYNDHLTAVIAYYVYIVLGFDYDSFAPFGGEPYFQTAQDILTNIPSGVAAVAPQGWRSLDGNRNRYWLIESILSPRMRKLRRGLYDYHRMGLDLMHEAATEGRNALLQTIRGFQEANRDYPNAMVLQLYSRGKTDEIIEIFKAAPLNEQNEVIQIMTRIDASNASKYRAIKS